MGSGREDILPRMEWGLLFLLMTLCVTLAASAIVLYMTRPRGVRTTIFPPLFYFTCIGLGYMAVEILAIKRGGLLIAQPVTATALVLGPFLLFSGLGSFAVENAARGLLQGRWTFAAIAAGAALLYAVIPVLIPLPDPGRTILFAGFICPLALLMGLPFPLGLRGLNSGRETSVPWIWAVSGYSSASGSALAGVLSVFGGHAVLLAVAVFFYLAAGALLGTFQAR
jgi:hypothetical protein